MSDAHVTVREIADGERDDWLRMKIALWPGHPAADHEADVNRYFEGARGDYVTFVALPGDRAVGFLELGQRSVAPECESSPVPFIEGWFVDADARGRGIGRALVEAAEAWSIAHGFTEIASDTDLENDAGQAAHRALGFEEVDRVVAFRKSLREP